MFFFFNDTATTEIYTLSLHDALPISTATGTRVIETRNAEKGIKAASNMTVNALFGGVPNFERELLEGMNESDRKSTRLNSSHANISYAVFCLKKKKNTQSRKDTTPRH